MYSKCIVLVTIHFGTIHYTLSGIHYTLSTIHYTLSTIHYTFATIHYTLLTIHYTLATIHYTLSPCTIFHYTFTIHLLYIYYTLSYQVKKNPKSL